MESCVVTVDYNRSWAEMIEAGQYNSVDPKITEEHFPITGCGKLDIEIVLGRFVRRRVLLNSDIYGRCDVKPRSMLDTTNFISASIEDLFALVEANRDFLFRQFPFGRWFDLLALGSTCGIKYVGFDYQQYDRIIIPCLHGFVSGPHFKLKLGYSCENQYLENSQALAYALVRKATYRSVAKHTRRSEGVQRRQIESIKKFARERGIKI